MAEHVLAVAHRSGEKITNLQLQKVLFFTMGMSIRHNPSELEFFNNIYDRDFEKWRYGPVVPNLYFSFNVYGDRGIENQGDYHLDLDRFDNLVNNLIEVNIYKLVALSHKMRAWKDYEPDILAGNRVEPYTLEEIVRDFNDA